MKRVKVFSGSSNILRRSLSGKEYNAVHYFPVFSFVIHYSRLSLPLAWKTLSNGILTIRDMSQLLDWTNYQLTWNWSTWSTHGELLLNCGTAIWTRGMLLQRKTAAMCFVLHCFSSLFKVSRLYVAFSLSSSSIWSSLLDCSMKN